MVTEGQDLVDCDVHCGAPDADTMCQYLPLHFQEYGYMLGRTRAADATYPSWVPALTTTGPEVSIERLRHDVLDRGARAILNSYFGVESFPHPYLAPALASAVNRWLQAEWLDQDDRLYASAVVAPQQTAAAVEEVHRVAGDPRFVQIAVPARSIEGYGHERYWPIWEAAAEHDLVVAIVYGGAPGTPPTPVGWLGSFFEHYVIAPTSFQAHVLSLTASGIFARLPNLRIALIESGWSWLPGLFWRFDEHWRALHREVPWLEVPPSTYIRRHFRFTTQPLDVPPDARQVRELLEQIGGTDLLMFGSDYPHDYGDDTSRFMAQLTPTEAERVLSATACDWYRLPATVTLDRSMAADPPGGHRTAGPRSD